MLLGAMLLAQFVPTLYAENLYVTPTGAGSHTGADWNNAFAGFSGVAWGSGTGQLGPGDTLWIAGGIYKDSLKLQGSGTAGNLISIKRCLGSDSACTSAAGWSSSYDSTVVINSVWGISLADFSSTPTGPGRYIVVDGREKDGIVLIVTNSNGNAGIRFYGVGSYYTTFRYISAYGPSTHVSQPVYDFGTNDVRGFFLGGGNYAMSDLTFEYCTSSGTPGLLTAGGITNLTIQYCDFNTMTESLGGAHGDMMFFSACQNLVIRYNTFHDSDFAEPIYFSNSGDGGVHNGNVSPVAIYGNIFRDAFGTGFYAIWFDSGATGDGPFYIYNNTYIGLGGVFNQKPLYTGGQSYFRNNLIVNAPSRTELPGADPHLTISNNIVSTDTSIFVQFDTGTHPASPYNWQYIRNLHLAAPSSSAGVALGSPFNRDMDGNTRGADGFWDIGAFEYLKISPPANLRIIKVHLQRVMKMDEDCQGTPCSMGPMPLRCMTWQCRVNKDEADETSWIAAVRIARLPRP